MYEKAFAWRAQLQANHQKPFVVNGTSATDFSRFWVSSNIQAKRSRVRLKFWEGDAPLHKLPKLRKKGRYVSYSKHSRFGEGDRRFEGLEAGTGYEGACLWSSYASVLPGKSKLIDVLKDYLILKPSPPLLPYQAGMAFITEKVCAMWRESKEMSGRFLQVLKIVCRGQQRKSLLRRQGLSGFHSMGFCFTQLINVCKALWRWKAPNYH